MNNLCPRECPNRNATCHIECTQHQLYREEIAQQKKQRQQEIAVKVYQVDMKNRSIREKRNHKLWKRENRKKCYYK